ncbi:MAG: hypothetical protein IPM02_18420 [Betaproteobacteria bacterium]|nr:hypothetical protein [Betaproteobacteria bacterium]
MTRTNLAAAKRMVASVTVAIIGACSLAAHASLTAEPASLSAARQQLARVGVPFVPNAGQWDREAAFAAQTFAGTVFVTRDGWLVYSLPGRPVNAVAADAAADGANAAQHATQRERRDGARTPGWVLTETFVGPDRQPIAATPDGADPATARVSYFTGSDATQPARDLGTFDRIDLGEVFPGIRVHLRATGANVEKIFTVAPGQDPGRIRLRVGGATRLELGVGGELIAHTGNGPLAYTAPVAFQEDGQGRREPVGVRYELDAAGDQYRFALAGYDPARPLVIDPLLQSTYVGGANDERALAVAIHPASGDVYVAGYTTTDSGFPGLAGGAQTVYGGPTPSNIQSGDVFVTRFNANLTSLIRSTYLGGAGGDGANALAIDPVSGDVVVAGWTHSADFPGVAGGAQPTFTGAGGSQPDSGNAFVSRLSADLGTLVRSTYLGGTASGGGFAGFETARALAIHPVSGDVYVAGQTSAADFPGVGSGAQSVWGGDQDAFVSRLSADLTTLKRSTYLGGSGGDQALALAIHPATGEVYVAGSTSSPTLPGTTGSAQPAPGGGSNDAFVARFAADLGTLIRSSYLGGAGVEDATALVIHPVSGEIYVAGNTTGAFPGVGGGAQGVYGGGGADAFVSRLSADLSALPQSSYLGGSDTDNGTGLAIHPATGEVYLTGNALSNNFPGSSGGAQGALGGDQDAYASRFSADLTQLLQSSYLGAAARDVGQAIAIHPTSGQVYVAGRTLSGTNTFPGVSSGAQGSFGGFLSSGQGGDAFVTRFSPDLTLGDNTPDPFPFPAQSNVPVASVRTAGPVLITGFDGQANVYVEGQPGSAFCASTAAGCLTCDISGGYVQSGSLSAGKYVCVRHTASSLLNQVTSTTLHVGGGAATFWVSTGTIFGGCSLDIDGNTQIDALTDGLMLLRAMFGLTGPSVTNGAVGQNATRATWELIRPYLNGNCGGAFPP